MERRPRQVEKVRGSPPSHQRRRQNTAFAQPRSRRVRACCVVTETRGGRHTRVRPANKKRRIAPRSSTLSFERRHRYALWLMLFNKTEGNARRVVVQRGARKLKLPASRARRHGPPLRQQREMSEVTGRTVRVAAVHVTGIRLVRHARQRANVVAGTKHVGRQRRGTGIE